MLPVQGVSSSGVPSDWIVRARSIASATATGLCGCERMVSSMSTPGESVPRLAECSTVCLMKYCRIVTIFLLSAGWIVVSAAFCSFGNAELGYYRPMATRYSRE